MAVTHYYHDSIAREYGTAVHYINNVATLPTPLNYFLLHYSHGSDVPVSFLRDLRFNGGEEIGSLLLLHDIDNPLWNTLTSTIYEFNAYNLPSMMAQAWHANDDVSLFSVDKRVLSPFFTLGGNYNPSMEPMLTPNISGSGDCFESIPIKYKNNDIDLSTDIIDRYTLNFQVSPILEILPYPQEYPIENKCGEFLKQNSHE